MRACSQLRKRLGPEERLGLNYSRKTFENSGQKVDTDASSFCKSLIIGAPYGIRTRVTALRGPCPRPLDEGSGLADLWALAA
jgi:hypothetical protein